MKKVFGGIEFKYKLTYRDFFIIKLNSIAQCRKENHKLVF